LFEEIGEQLAIDRVVRVDGRVSGTDKLGNKIPDPKIIAEKIVIVSDDELDNYQATGQKMEVTPNSPVDRKPTMSRHIKEPAVEPEAMPEPVVVEPLPVVKKLYIHVKDPSDQDKLLKAKTVLGQYSGSDSIILVLGDGKKDALKMPFTTDANDKLIGELGEIYGADCVVVK
jgi:hypothetical protein